MDTYPVVEWLTLNTTYTLTSAITAFRTSADDQENDRRGPICELTEGTELEVCGGGFSKQTVKVRYGDCYYYVFWRDLASASTGIQPGPPDEPVDLLRLAQKLENQDQAKVEMSDLANTNRE